MDKEDEIDIMMEAHQDWYDSLDEREREQLEYDEIALDRMQTYMSTQRF